MKNKLNIVLLSLSILASVVIIFITISMVRAWYTNAIQTGDINAETKELSIKYQLNEGSENIVEYNNITNLAFFDIDSDEEGKYLRAMAFKIDIDLENNSTDNVSYEIKFESAKTIKKDSSNNEISIAYAACIFDNVSDDTKNAVEDYYLVGATNTNYEITYAYKNVPTFEASKKSAGTNYLLAKANATGTHQDDYKTRVTLYVFGIQEVDSAANEDFLYDTNDQNVDTQSYQFTLSIIANPVGSAVVTENPDQNNGGNND